MVDSGKIGDARSKVSDVPRYQVYRYAIQVRMYRYACTGIQVRYTGTDVQVRMYRYTGTHVQVYKYAIQVRLGGTGTYVQVHKYAIQVRMYRYAYTGRRPKIHTKLATKNTHNLATKSTQ
eukprot:SAG11_NODE_20218_length_450_cov_0.817664_1_plen_120_part_00